MYGLPTMWKNVPKLFVQSCRSHVGTEEHGNFYKWKNARWHLEYCCETFPVISEFSNFVTRYCIIYVVRRNVTMNDVKSTHSALIQSQIKSRLLLCNCYLICNPSTYKVKQVYSAGKINEGKDKLLSLFNNTLCKINYWIFDKKHVNLTCIYVSWFIDLDLFRGPWIRRGGTLEGSLNLECFFLCKAPT